MSWLCGQAVVLHQAVCSVAVSFSTKESNNCLSVHCAASAWRQYNTAAAAAADAADAAAAAPTAAAAAAAASASAGAAAAAAAAPAAAAAANGDGCADAALVVC